MLLYDAPASGNCYKVRLLLAHLGREYERVVVDLIDRSDRGEVLGGLNPALRVPVLRLDDGRHLAESNAILWYLAEGTELLPADRFERARVLQWMFFEQNQLEPSIGTVRYWVHILGTADEHAKEIVPKMEAGTAGLAALDAHLTTRAYLVGPRLSVADIALFGYVSVAHEGGFDMDAHPAVRIWLDRVAAEPAHITIAD